MNRLIRELIDFPRGLTAYVRDMITYTKKNKGRFKIRLKHLYPRINDRYRKAGAAGSYFWQDIWAARLIYENAPQKHYDIGSRIDGFIGHLASFRENIVLIDVRGFDYTIPGVTFVQADATSMEGIEDE